MTLDHVPGVVKASTDIASAGILLGTIAQLLPHVAAVLTIVWTLIRIYETDTVREFCRRARRIEDAPATTGAAAVRDQDTHHG